MPALFLSEGAILDLGRIADFLAEADPDAGSATPPLIREALEVLVRHPRIGRPTIHGYRELVISQGHAGYVALYELDEAQDRILVHAIRHQRETGFDD
jgi:plasmid stabilization system protein ParE